MSCSINRTSASASALHTRAGAGLIVSIGSYAMCFGHRRKLEDLSPLISVWQFDFKPVMMTAPRSFVTIGFSVKLPVSRRGPADKLQHMSRRLQLTR